MAGQSFPSSDGCNTCTCSGRNRVTCTERACLPNPPKGRSHNLFIFLFLSTAEGQRCCQGNLYFGSREKYFIVSYGMLIHKCPPLRFQKMKGL